MFDYKVLSFSNHRAMESELQILGKQGWKVISVIPFTNFTIKIIVTLEKEI